LQALVPSTAKPSAKVDVGRKLQFWVLAAQEPVLRDSRRSTEDAGDIMERLHSGPHLFSFVPRRLGVSKREHRRKLAQYDVLKMDIKGLDRRPKRC
jgi:hypothetical protein